MTAGRAIVVRLDVHPSQPGTWRLMVECQDEVTSWTMTAGAAGASIAPPSAADLEGAVGQALIQEHVSRCGSCSRRPS